MRKTALTAALILILAIALIIAFASSMLSNSAITQNDTEPVSETEPTNETEQTDQPEVTNETEQWSTPTRITSRVARGLCMSADGKKIAFLDGYDLFLMNTDGTGLKQLTHYDTDGLNPNTMGRPSISANGGKIAFKASKTVGSGPPSFYHGHYETIIAAKTDGTESNRVYPNPTNLDYEHLPEFQHTMSDPKISSDGEKVTFVSDSKLYIVNSDGTGLLLLSDNANGVPSVTYDGTKVAFSATKGNYSELYLINSDGTELTKVASSPILSPSNYTIPFGTHSISTVYISGDSNKIAFTLDYPWFTYALYVVNSDGTGLANLYHNVTETVSLSHDGSKIVFVSRKSDYSYNLYVINSDGTGLTFLSSNGDNYGGFSISGNGRKIAFSYRSEYGTFISELGKESQTPEPTAPPVQTNSWNKTQIVSLSSVSFYTGLSMSGDGSKIAFSAYNFDGDHQLYVVNSDGTGLTQLTSKIGPVSSPVISGDGNKVAFTAKEDRWDVNSYRNIFVVNSDGTGLAQLTNTTWHNSASSMNYDGSLIAFVSGDLGNSEICFVNSDGTGLTQVTENFVEDGGPSINTEGLQIAFYEGWGNTSIILAVHE